MNPKKVMGGASGAMGKMQQLATDTVMEQAVEDKLKQEHAKRMAENDEAVALRKAMVIEEGDSEPEEDKDEDDSYDEDELEIMRKMAESKVHHMTYEEQKRQDKKRGECGEYTEVDEQNFFDYVTKNKYSVCHFYHNDFNRCKIIDHHLRIIAYHHAECKIIHINVANAPFLVNKLQVQVLPAVIMFKDGVKVDEMVGFTDLGDRDDFDTVALTRRLAKAKVLTLRDDEKFRLTAKPKEKHAGFTDSEED